MVAERDVDSGGWGGCGNGNEWGGGGGYCSVVVTGCGGGCWWWWWMVGVRVARGRRGGGG